MYNPIRAADFGPHELKNVREKMLQADKTYYNWVRQVAKKR